MAGMANNSSGLGCFDNLENGLLGLGLAEDARRLHGTVVGVYTTSSEMFGEIGETVRHIHRAIPESARVELRSEFAACVKVVRTVWPEFAIDG
jgi:hypothetical protein